MDIDQIELLTHDKTRATNGSDARSLIDKLPVKQLSHEAKVVCSSIRREPEDPPPPGESPWVQAFLSGLSWVTYAFAIGAAMFLTWGAVDVFTFR